MVQCMDLTDSSAERALSVRGDEEGVIQLACLRPADEIFPIKVDQRAFRQCAPDNDLGVSPPDAGQRMPIRRGSRTFEIDDGLDYFIRVVDIHFSLGFIGDFCDAAEKDFKWIMFGPAQLFHSGLAPD
ncbi:hypothetical protein N183_38035 [Sinorhizobium sp. Sb3]|nr:hypothetical protein N183_38035 [Sinorhizobium sp. Sb3]